VGTVNSRAYDDAFAAATHIQHFTQACPRFVEFVEAGVTTGRELFDVAEQYLAPLREQNVDTLVLGCTHYPFLRGAISYVMGDAVTLVSSDTETANDVYRTLVDRGLAREDGGAPTYRYEATGDSAEDFLALAHRLLGPQISRVDLIETGALSLGSLQAFAAQSQNPKENP
jgi:glutamate racemase